MRYRRYRSYRYRGWGHNSPSKYSNLQGLFGEAVAEIRRHFFQLDSEGMDELLADYGSLHGKGAENYARATIEKWKSGATKLSGQTMERLIELVPPYLSAQQRLELLTIILEKNKKSPPSRVIRIDVKEPALGLAELDAALSQLQVTDELAYLPSNVMSAAKWLYDDDMTVARAAIVSIAAVETNALKQSAAREISLLRRTLQSGQIKAASYTVRTPGGNLEVVAYSPSACFIANACFGQHDFRTGALRRWRDDTLLESPLGRRFVVWYYFRGEKIADWVAERPFLLMVSRFSVTAVYLAIVSFRAAARVWHRGKMSDRKNLSARTDQSQQSALQNSGLGSKSLLDLATSNLTPSEIDAIRQKALDERLRLEVDAQQRSMDYQFGRKAAEDHIDTFNMLDKSGGLTSQKVISDIKTGAGNMRLESKSGPTCFVASAAYGDPDHADVAFLRRYRNQILKKTASGRVFISIYWWVGPILAVPVQQNYVLKNVTKSVIGALVRALRRRQSVK